jgi:hypothetical protein
MYLIIIRHIIFIILQTPNRNQNYNIPNQGLIRTKIRILMHIFSFRLLIMILISVWSLLYLIILLIILYSSYLMILYQIHPIKEQTICIFIRHIIFIVSYYIIPNPSYKRTNNLYYGQEIPILNNSME